MVALRLIMWRYGPVDWTAQGKVEMGASPIPTIWTISAMHDDATG